MEFTLKIPDYDGNAVDVIWNEKCQYSINIEDNEVELSMNKEAMIAMAKQLIYLATNNIETGSHIHYSEFFCKNNNSDYELILTEKF